VKSDDIAQWIKFVVGILFTGGSTSAVAAGFTEPHTESGGSDAEVRFALIVGRTIPSRSNTSFGRNAPRFERGPVLVGVPEAKFIARAIYVSPAILVGPQEGGTGAWTVELIVRLVGSILVETKVDEVGVAEETGEAVLVGGTL
jgi:hypothetical protein